MSAATRFGHLGGGLLTAAGALGLAVTGLAAPLTPMGDHLLVFEVNPAQNLLHLVLGITMVLGAARSDRAAGTTALLATATLGTLGVVGLAITGPAGNALALDAWGNALHLGLAGWGAVATLATGTRPPSTTETPAMRHP